eukprot:6574130-Heterocapsa_arctica.AAC.1
MSRRHYCMPVCRRVGEFCCARRRQRRPVCGLCRKPYTAYAKPEALPEALRGNGDKVRVDATEDRDDDLCAYLWRDDER